MQHSLSRYLVIYTVAQLPMLVIAAFFPYIFSMDTSPNLRALLRVLPGVFPPSVWCLPPHVDLLDT